MSQHKKNMTADEIIAILCRLKTITRPPWTNQLGVVIAGEKTIAVALYARGVTREDQAANAEFIAHAPNDISRLVDEVSRLNKVSRYLAEQMVHDGGAGLRWAGAFDEDCMRMYKTKEEAIQSWLDEANREVSDAE